MRKFLIFCLFFLPITILAQTFEWNGGGNGISWEDSLNWIGGTPPGGNIGHDVIIDGANSVKINSSFAIGTLRLKSSRLTIDNTYTLSVIHSTTAPGDTLSAVDFVQSEVDVKGKLYISSSDRNFALSLRRTDMFVYAGAEVDIAASVYGLAIYNNGDLDLKTGSLLEIDADSLAIQNNQSIENNGKIEIDAAIDGIINNGNFSSSDTLIIDGYGISMLTAIENNGVFTNKGYLDINNVNLYGIYNTGTFSNSTGSYLKVYDITPSALSNSSAFYSIGSFINDGEIFSLVRAEYGFYNEENTSGFVNNGTAYITGADSMAFINAGTVSDSSFLVNNGKLELEVGADVLFNNTYGKVSWNGTGLLGGHDGLINQGKFDLDGDSLKIDVDETAIINDGYMHNSGHIHVEVCENGIDNTGEFYNLNLGEILLTSSFGDSESFGIRNQFTFENDGLIDLNNAIYGLKNEGSYLNGGEIVISQSTTAFIENYSLNADSSYFNNNGNILLKQSIAPSGYHNVGIWNHDKGSFKSEGPISMNAMWQDTENIKNDSYFYFNDSLNIKETREVNIINSGYLASGGEALLEIDFSENFGEYVIDNQGEIEFNGRSSFLYFDTYQRNVSLINNESVITNKGYLKVDGLDEVEGVFNSGTFINQDTMVLNRVRVYAIDNAGVFMNQSGALIQIDSFMNVIKTGVLFQNDGVIDLPAETNIEVGDNDVFTNSGLIKLKNGIGDAIRIFGISPIFSNLAGGEVLIDSTEVPSSLDTDGIKIESGQLINSGLLRLIGISDRGINMVGGSLVNNDTLIVASVKGYNNISVEDASFINNGFLHLDGSGQEPVSLLNVLSSGSLENNGQIEINDAHTKGIYNIGLFSTGVNSSILFDGNQRNTQYLLYHNNAYSPVIYNGSIKSLDSKSCVSFSGAVVNNGFIDLRDCGADAMVFASGTNSTAGHILLDYGSFVGTNEGIIEYFSDSLSDISGTDVMTNLGVIIDHGNQFRSTKFNDSDALGFPIWNKGLFISPFYGNLSDGIRETVNLNYTESGSLTISDSWYSDRAMTSAVGTWHQTEHYFTPNTSANAADSLFLEVDLSGSTPVVLSVPHKQISVCPQPIVTKILRTKAEYNWNDHTTWRGNRAPDYCDKVSISGYEDVYIPASYRAKLNTIDYTPQWGEGNYIDIQYGSVMEINALPYE